MSELLLVEKKSLENLADMVRTVSCVTRKLDIDDMIYCLGKAKFLEQSLALSLNRINLNFQTSAKIIEEV